MSYSSDVSAYVTDIANVASESKSQHQPVLSSIRDITNYWKGESYDAFRKKFAGVDQDAKDMHESLSRVYSALRNLKTAIDQADDERRQEAAKQQS